MFIIAGKYYRRKILAPKTQHTRPTASRLRETLFNIIQMEIEGVDFLDVFAGSGAMGIEALSRGAKSAFFIESGKEAYSALNGNLKMLQIGKEAQVLFGDYLKNLQLLGSRKKQFDIIFADAPYALTDASLLLLEQIEKQSLLKPQGKVFIENDKAFEKEKIPPSFQHVNSRQSGKSFLHYFKSS